MFLYFKKYSLIQLFFLIIQIFISKVFINLDIRLIKLPFSIIGKENILFGKNFTSGKNLRIECLNLERKKVLFIGSNVKVNDYVHIACINKIIIGDNVLIGSHVLITDHQHGQYDGEDQDTPYSSPDERKLYFKTVVIEKNVWIGDMVSIMPNVTIGSGTIIGANSVVTKDIPKNCIAVGNPCKVIKKFDDHTQSWKKVVNN